MQTVKKLHSCLIAYVGATIGRPPTYRSNAFSGTVSCKANGHGRAMLAPTRVFRQSEVCCYEGNFPEPRGSLSGPGMVCRFRWQARANPPQTAQQISPTALKRLDISIKYASKMAHQFCRFCAIQQKQPMTSFCHGLMAERKGFEPLRALGALHDFQSCALDQLSHLSTYSVAQRLTA